MPTVFADRLRQYCFLIFCLITYLVSYINHHLQTASDAALIELAMIVDYSIAIPAIYFLIHRKNTVKTLIKSLGLVALGITLATLIIPEQERFFLNDLLPIRYILIAIFTLAEIGFLFLLYKAMFTQNAEHSINNLAKSADLPNWLTRLLLLEARFWAYVKRVILKIFK